jgi:hypothetical protein
VIAADMARQAICARCGHSSGWHRLDDSLNLSPNDPAAPFRCIGYDCTAAGPPGDPCGCPDFVGHADDPMGESGIKFAFDRVRFLLGDRR